MGGLSRPQGPCRSPRPHTEHRTDPQRMVAAARANLAAIEHDRPIKCVLADAGYWNHDEIAAVQATTAAVIVPTSDPHNTQRKRAPKQGAKADRINTILATRAGRRLSRRR